MQDQSSTQSFEILITHSDFYIQNKDVKASPWFTSGDILSVTMPTASDQDPTLVVYNPASTDKLSFKTINNTYSCNALSAATLFVTFDVQLEDAPEFKWRFELFSQRIPSKVCYKPNNQDLETRYNFYVLDQRFDHKDTSCGQPQHNGNDGSGGGLNRK
ncbi:hypothetical protein [Halioxenophilus aromaticivorans]|uniref:Uncharacterized protein n=1 Tax=Halioxenophilus aromaticivorans TaxID=1306992 RepID=A0AAV3U4I0_9ALTE